MFVVQESPNVERKLRWLDSMTFSGEKNSPRVDGIDFRKNVE